MLKSASKNDIITSVTFESRLFPPETMFYFQNIFYNMHMCKSIQNYFCGRAGIYFVTFTEQYKKSRINRLIFMERATGIEPAYSAWEADVLPLNYARENKKPGFGTERVELVM